MDKAPSKKHSSSKASATAGSSKQVADVNKQLSRIDHELRKLDVELSNCRTTIYENLKVRENLVQTICLLISKIERSLAIYEQAEKEKRNETCDDSDDEDGQYQEILEDLHVFQQSVELAQRHFEVVRNLCTMVEPYLKLQMAENEALHEDLCAQLEDNQRFRREALAKRKQLVKARNLKKREKKTDAK